MFTSSSSSFAHPSYSYRNAVIGAMLDARRAGT
jgi:hypothetical protein